jgi:ubiquinol-cytochrome c reductase iron-sulfur subunit
MSCDGKVDCGRRRLLVATAAAGGAAGVVAVVPFVASMLPSERAKSAGAPVEADISKLAPGEMMTVEWRGKPVWIIHRTKEMLDGMAKLDDKLADPKSEKQMQPSARTTRGRKPESGGGWHLRTLVARRPAIQ